MHNSTSIGTFNGYIPECSFKPFNRDKGRGLKGSHPNMKCHKLWKKSIRGGGVKAKIKIVYISNVDYFVYIMINIQEYLSVEQ